MRVATVRSSLCLLFQILGLCNALGLQERDLGPEFTELTNAIVTPHIDWAPKMEGGFLRVLYIGQTGHARDLVELSQRFDVQVSHLFTARFGFAYPPGHPWMNVKGFGEQDMLRRFRSLIVQDIDAIVPDGQFMFEVWPDEVIYRILDKVKQGSGLVIFTHYPCTGDDAQTPVTKRRPEIDAVLYNQARRVEDKAGFLSCGVPLKSLTAWSSVSDGQAFADKMVRTQFGKGRILILTDLYPPTGSEKVSLFTPATSFNSEYAEFCEREYYYAFAMKALQWAARREPEVRLESFTLRGADGRVVEAVDAVKTNKCRVELTLSNAPGEAQVEWTVRSRKGESLHTSITRVENGRATTGLPRLPRGQHVVSVIIRRGGATLNWGSFDLRVESSFSISRLEANVPSLAPGTTAIITSSFSQPVASGMKVRFTATGNYERCLARETLSTKPGEDRVTWRYTHQDRLGRMLWIGVELLIASQVIDRREMTIPVRLPVAQDEFHMMMWGGLSDEFPLYLQAWNLANLGFDSMLVGYLGANPIIRKTDKSMRRIAEAGSRLNLAQWAYVSHHHPKSEENNIRTPCLTDPVFQQSEREKLRAFARVLKDYGVMYMLGDENTLQTPGNDLCFSPTCQDDFRRYLKGVYGDLSSLNREWGTALTSWDEVTPVNLKTAQESGQPARWVDHRLHMSRVWVDIYRKSQAWIRELDKGAPVGVDYLCRDHGDFGEVELARTLSVLSPLEIAGEAVRSLDLPHMVKGTFSFWGFHGNCLTKQHEWKRVWEALLRGSALCVAFASHPGDAQSYIAPDLRPMPYFTPALKEAEVIKGGLDKLLLPLRDSVSVGVVWSEAAQFAGRFHETLFDHRNTYLAFRDLLWEAGTNCHLVPAEDLSETNLSSRFRLLVLPACTALSEAQSQTLAQFVEEGGLLVADVRPGIFDEHGKPRQCGSLDDLFGVDGSSKMKMEHGSVAFTVNGKQQRLEDVLFDRSAVVTTGHAALSAAGIPLLVSRSHGRGKAVQLNLSAEFSFHGANRDAGLDLIRSLLREANVHCATSHGRANHYHDGQNEYIVFVNNTTECEVTFQNDGHLYDGRHGKYLGVGKTVRLDASKPEGRWVSRLGYQVKSVRLAGAEKVPQGDVWSVNATVIASGGVPGRHVLCARLFGPDGKERRYYRQKVELARGQGRIVIPFCLNDAIGQWRMEVTDVATGVTSVTATALVANG